MIGFVWSKLGRDLCDERAGSVSVFIDNIQSQN